MGRPQDPLNVEVSGPFPVVVSKDEFDGLADRVVVLEDEVEADATSTTKGVVRLAGDLAGTADSPTVPGLADKANAADVAASITATSTYARNRVNHTGTQSLDTTTDSGTRLALTPAERNKLATLAPVAFVADPLNPGFYYNVDGSGQIIYPVDQVTYGSAQRYLKIGGGGTVDGISQGRANGVTSRAIRTDSAAFHHWDPVAAEWHQDEKVSVFGEGTGGGAVGRAVAPSQPLRHWLLALGDIWKTDDEGASWTRMGLTLRMYANDDWRTSNPRIAIDPRNHDHVLVGTQYDGLQRTTDGTTFAPVSLPVDVMKALKTWTASGYAALTRNNGTKQSNAGVFVRFDPTSGAGSDGLTLRAYMIVAGVAVLKTEDSGRTWTDLAAPWPVTSRGFATSPANGDVAIVTAPPAWSITRPVATTGGTFTITITDSGGSATTTALDHHADGTTIRNALNALGKGTYTVDTYVSTNNWTTTKTIDFLISASSTVKITGPAPTLTLDSSQLVGGPLVLIEDTASASGSTSSKVVRYRPGAGWSDITPTGAARTFGAIVYSPHTPGHMMTAALGGMDQFNRVRISTNYGDTWSWPAALVADELNSDVEWQGNLAAHSNLGISFVSAAWDLDDPYTVIATEGIGVWRYKVSDLTSAPATLTLSSMTSGVEQMVANDMVTLPPRPGSLDTRVICASWDRPLFIQTDRTKNPIDYKPDSAFGSGWSVATLPGDPDFAIATVMNHQDGGGSNRSCYTTDGGDTWTPYSLPDTTNYSWGMGQIAPSTRLNWLVSCPGSKAPRYTLDGGQTWTAIVLPTGAADAAKADTTLPTQYTNRHAIAALGPLWFVLMVKYVGVFVTKDGGATWTKRCDWVSVNMGTSNDAYPARLHAVNYQTGLVGGGTKAHLWWITGNTSSNGGLDLANKTVRSVDQGATWQVVTGLGTVHALAFGPTFDGRPGYVTLAVGFDTAGAFATLVSVDQGTTWHKVGGRLNDMFVTAKTAAGDPQIPGRFYVGTPSGYFQVDVNRTFPA